MIIIEESKKDNYPEDYVRLDLAWKLFLPSNIGDIPTGHGKNLIPIANWFWDVMASKSGNLNADSKNEIHVVVPQLNDAGLDFVVRLCSLWSSEVFFGDLNKNLFVPPVINIYEDPKGSQTKLVRDDRMGLEKFITPLLGPSRMFVRIEEILPGHDSARLHSHSAIDEFYLILRGKGHLRFNDKLVEIKSGDLIGKVRGPDNSTQIKADLGEAITVLDIEIWPDTRYNEKDVLGYPDYGEIYLRGQGWSSILPTKSMTSGRDILTIDHYYGNYKRAIDGSKVKGSNEH